MTTTPLFPPFSEIQVATETVVCQLNALFDLPSLFERLPCLNPGEWTDESKLPINVASPNAHLTPGSIAGLSYNSISRGATTGVFKNSLVVLMYMGEREVSNFKVSRLGKIQITGVKAPQQFVLPVVHLLKHLTNVFGTPSLWDHNLPETDPARPIPPIRRLIAAPAGPQFPGWQCWAVVAMYNAYISLPYSSNLVKLRDFVTQRPQYAFTATFEMGVNQSMAIKALTRITPEEAAVIHHPYFTVVDYELTKQGTAVPNYHLTSDSIVNLRAIEALGAQLVPGGVSSSKSPKKTHQGTLLTYATKRTFMSAPGLEVERLYNDFVRLMTEYYATSTAEEKAGANKPSRRKASSAPQPRKPATKTKNVSSSSSSSSSGTGTATTTTVMDALAEKMQAMRIKRMKLKAGSSPESPSNPAQ